MAADCVIYRIIGNALPPRHDPEHTRRNLRFILEREGELEGCEKRWLLNRIVDTRLARECVAMIEESGQGLHVIHFDPASYRATFYDASGMPAEFNPLAQGAMGEEARQLPAKAYEWMMRHKSLNLINLNAARNTAVELGTAEATWTLPLDGWSFFTREAWRDFRDGIARNPGALYAMLPIGRLADNSQLDAPASLPHAADEPQIAFHRDAPDRFDERLRYGNMNKAELIQRLGYPGPWHRWKSAAWEVVAPVAPVAPNRFVACGRIYRLASGASSEVEESSGSRHVARFQGVSRLAHGIDRFLLARALEHGSARDHGVLAPGATWPATKPLERLQCSAEDIAAAPMPSILDKTGLAPSGNPRDYLSAPRYEHAVAGRHERIDGEAVPEAIIGSPESRTGDRTALWECIRNASVLTASGVLCDRRDHRDGAAALLRAWFVDPATAMQPHARFAQMHPDRPDEPNHAGLIDFRDLWMLPALCRSLRASEALAQQDVDAIVAWSARLLAELKDSEQGKAAFGARNNIGTWCHLLRLSLAVFAGRIDEATSLLSAATLRLVAQCDAGGAQPGEAERSRPLHYSLFNLTAWVLLADLCRALGVDIWRYRGVDGQSLCRMLRHGARMASREGLAENAPYWRRWLSALLLLVPDHAADRALLPERRVDANAPWTDDPDRGFPPHWWYFLLWRKF